MDFKRGGQIVDASNTVREFKLRLNYDPISGLFTRKVTVRGVLMERPAGYIRRDGYRYIGVCGKYYLAHRLAWLFYYGEFPKKRLDHINHNRDDNSIKNLRQVSTRDNCLNKKLYKRNTSGVPGVIWDTRRKKWCASIGVKMKLIYLGGFVDKFEAFCARLSAESKYNFHPNHGA